MLEPSAIKEFYDRFGARQDRQGFYEDRALDDLLTQASLADAQTIVEFGCGTGRFAKEILTMYPGPSYVGFDVSAKMIQLAQSALSSFGNRAAIHQLPAGTIHLPIPDQSADRIISTYVLDLLPTADIEAFLQHAQRMLKPDGRLCLVSLTDGPSLFPRFVASVWGLVYRVKPQLVGGCRPIHLTHFCRQTQWDILHHRINVAWGISSEVLVLRVKP